MNWIKESYNKSKILKDHYKLHNIEVFIKDKLPEGVNFDLCLKAVAKLIPARLLSGVDIIYVGQFDFLKKRNLNAIYDAGAIYITNAQENDQDIINDIIQSFMHSNDYFLFSRIGVSSIYIDYHLKGEMKNIMNISN